jgi:VIT1/CCC1 family predicted Fe2+/Mn2+ transporter
LIGLSNVIAAAVAMGANEYLSSKAHHDFVLTEKRREKWEYKNHKDAEVKEMVHLFVNRGMSHPDAELVVKKMAEYEDFFVDLIVSQELGQLSDDSELNFLQDGFIMFISFASFGILPLIPFVFGAYDLLPENNLAMISVCSTLSLLFFLGCIKSTFRSPLLSFSFSSSCSFDSHPALLQHLFILADFRSGIASPWKCHCWSELFYCDESQRNSSLNLQLRREERAK